MGIFDNVNWAQAIPTAMAGFAGAADPNHSSMLAQGGWNAVQSYMQQQKMQQDQEQFQQRMKIADQESKQRERYLQQSEKRFAQEQDEKLDEDFIFQNLGVLNDISDEAGISEYYNRLNAKAKESGRGPLSSTVFGKVAKQWEFMPTSTGEVGFGYKSDGTLWVMEKVKHKGGVKWQPSKVADRITPEMIKALRENPEMALEFANSLDKSGHGEAAVAVRKQAERILGERKAAAVEKTYGDRLRMLKQEQEVLEGQLKMNFNYNKEMGTYDNPHQPGTPEAKEWDAALKTAQKAVADRILGGYAEIDEDMRKSNPDYAKRVESEKKREAAEFEKTLSEEEKALYITALTDLASAGIPQKEAGPRVRAMIELRRKKGRNVHAEPERAPRGEKKDTVVTPKRTGVPRRPGEAYIEPSNQAFDWSMGGRIPLGGMGMNALGAVTDRSMDYITRMLTPTQRPPRGWQGY